MATQTRFKSVIARMFGLFLFVVAAGNFLVGQLDFGILFAVMGFVFVSLSGYILSNPDQFGNDETVSDRRVRIAVLGGWGLILLTAVVIAALALS